MINTDEQIISAADFAKCILSCASLLGAVCFNAIDPTHGIEVESAFWGEIYDLAEDRDIWAISGQGERWILMD